MIRNDIKNLLSGKNLEEIFLENRPGIDQPGYRVGEVELEDGTKNIVTWNPTTGEIMDYFYDDRLDIISFDISNIFIFDGGYVEKDKYYLHRNGILKSKFTNRNLLIRRETYPSYNITYISTNNRSGHSKRALIHVLLAKMFIPKYDQNKNIVDHIDHDKYNYNFSNLRWASISENCSNSSETKKIVNKSFIWEAYKDINFTKKAFSISSEDLYYSSIYNRHLITKSINKKTKVYGYYWKCINLELQEYLNKFGIPNIDESLWKSISSNTNLSVHPIGLVKNLRTGKISLGTEHFGYRVIRDKNSRYCVHRLIAETFLNGGKPILENLVVDHISTDSLDNRVENLRICTQSDNMHNPKTVEKFGHKVIDKEGKIFPTVTECAKYHKVSRATIQRWIKDPNKDFNYYNN